MSLLVNAYTRDETGKMTIVPMEDHAQELAGFEVFRERFYGGETARSLGLQLLPSLSEGDLYCEGEDLARLRKECEMILQNIEIFSAEAGDMEVLRFRVCNIIAAIERGQQYPKGGVVIW
jgi:hypothetical protein